MDGMTVFGPERFSLIPDRNQVFGWLGCGRDIPCRQAFERSWEPAAACLAECMVPQAVIARQEDGTLTVFLTLGPEPEERMSALFQRREYVTGSLLNTMSDALLFQMDRQAALLIGGMLRAERLYIASRMEPGTDLTADLQREKLLPFRELLPFVRISETGVLFPTKSMMYVLTVSDEPCRLEALHDCSVCSQKNCPYRDSDAPVDRSPAASTAPRYANGADAADPHGY